MVFNLGTADRIFRVLVGIALIAWAVMGGPVLAWAGVILLVTGLVKFCPAYAIFGIKTCKID